MCEENNFAEKFKIVHFFDFVRWNQDDKKDPYSLNYANKNYSNDVKLLAHWLAYITDRQMPFEQIWDKGGLIFSEIANDFITNKKVDCILPNNEDSYFRKVTGKKDEFEFVSHIKYENLVDEQKNRLSRYYSEDELKKLEKITFKSRFYTDDYLCMLYTLSTLEKLKCSFVDFIAKIISNVISDENIKDKVQYCVLGIAYFLDRLTYNRDENFNGEDIKYFYFNNNNKRVTHDNLEEFINKEFNDKTQKRKKSIMDDLNKNISDLLDGFENTSRKYTSMKRTWCALRDYLKAKAYYPLLKEELESKLPYNKDIVKALFDENYNHKNACKWLELPGDVWNENSTFRKCITQNRKGKLGAVLRTQYKKEEPEQGYPEEFDTTFDFVPRMCEKGNCEICPFAKYNCEKKFDESKFGMLCVKSKGKYCPLMLLYCGYFKECDGDSCELIKIIQTEN